MNIWQILATVVDDHRISPSQAMHLLGCMTRDTQTNDTDALVEALYRRTGFDWFVCDAGSGVWPITQRAVTVYDDDRLSQWSIASAPATWGMVAHFGRRPEQRQLARLEDATYVLGVGMASPYFVEHHAYNCAWCGMLRALDDLTNDTCPECLEEADSDDDDSGYDDSGDDDSGDDDRVWSYGTNILDVVLGRAWIDGPQRTYSPVQGTRYYGIELEIDPKESYHKLVTACTSHCQHMDAYILKQDGSIDGVELVTVPATFESHKTHIEWEAILKKIQPYGVSGTRTYQCGMHIHVSRSSISQLTLGKLIVFINSPVNSDFVEAVAQRSHNTYCAIKAKGITDLVNTDRFEAINTTNMHTIEVRIFRGNLRYDRVMKNLEFVEALLNHLKNTSIREIGHKPFIRFVERNAKLYPNLHNFLVEKGIAKQTKTVSPPTIGEM